MRGFRRGRARLPATFSSGPTVWSGVRSPGRDCGEFVAARHAPMLRAAFLLTGSQQDAEDLVQDALVRVVGRWARVSAADDPVAYADRMLVNAFLTGRRRRWHGEIPHADPPDAIGDGGYERVDERDRLRRALLALPARQRAAVVLRHYEQQSEAQTATVMGCSVGTVKSLTSRGLAALRTRLPADQPTTREVP
jgi:RNA polymerase sigma-70 factor (sigma-E family)